jgi:hypothetical protein
VLVCPQCQSGRDWAAELDRCAGCGSVRLVRRLGEAECRECAQAGEPAVAADGGLGAAGEAVPGARDGGSAGALAEEVARALDRVLGPHRVPR